MKSQYETGSVTVRLWTNFDKNQRDHIHVTKYSEWEILEVSGAVPATLVGRPFREIFDTNWAVTHSYTIPSERFPEDLRSDLILFLKR